jgi:hypothetical protein
MAQQHFFVPRSVFTGAGNVFSGAWADLQKTKATLKKPRPQKMERR